MRASILAATLLLAGCSTPHLVWQGLNVLDIGQTVHIAREPTCYREIGPITADVIGSHPSEAEAVAYLAALGAGYALLADWLDRRYASDPGTWERPRAAFYAITIGWKLWIVAENHNIGLRPFGSGC